MTREEIIQAISDDETMPFIQPDQLANIVDFVIKNYNPFLSSNLEEAAEKLADEHGFVKHPNCKPAKYSYQAVRDVFCEAAIAGAKYQRKQDQQLIELAEDHAMLAGMNKMKEEMMEKAVDGRVIKSYNPVTAIGQPTLHGIELIYPDMDKPYIIAGDTVKVIFIPEKSEKVK